MQSKFPLGQYIKTIIMLMLSLNVIYNFTYKREERGPTNGFLITMHCREKLNRIFKVVKIFHMFNTIDTPHVYNWNLPTYLFTCLELYIDDGRFIVLGKLI